MACTCDIDRIAFSVPESLHEIAPDEASALEICPRCLDLTPAAPEAVAADPEFTRIVSEFPSGAAGAAMALALGLLVDSVAMHREAVGDCFDIVAEAGADPWIVIERLAVAPTVQPDADLDRIRRQLDQLTD